MVVNLFEFIKEVDNRWFVSLPEYIEKGGEKDDLEMIAGSREILELMARGGKQVHLLVDVVPFKGADELTFTEREDGSGGGYYVMKTYRQIPIDHELWLCHVLKTLFGVLPQKIYIKNVEPAAAN